MFKAIEGGRLSGSDVNAARHPNSLTKVALQS